MRRLAGRHPSPAMVLAFIALLAALSGTAIALPGKNRVDSGDIRQNTIRSGDIRNGNVRNGDLGRNSVTSGKVRNNNLTGADINEGSLGQVPSANTANTANTADTANSANSAGSVDGLGTIPLRRAAPTNGADINTARTAAPKIPLLSKGPLTIYGKCFSYGTSVTVGTYIETSTPGAVYDSRSDELTGGTTTTDYLNPGTEAVVNSEDTATGNDTVFDNEDENDFSVLAADGTVLRGLLAHGAKRGTVAFDGGWGPGDGCVWFGFAIG